MSSALIGILSLPRQFMAQMGCHEYCRDWIRWICNSWWSVRHDALRPRPPESQTFAAAMAWAAGAIPLAVN